jgi:replicative DNA helicase
LDAAEAIAIAGMALHNRVGPVPSTSFDHPGRRALVGHWERVGRVALTVDAIEAAAKHVDVDPAALRDSETHIDVAYDSVAIAVADIDASMPLAESPVRLREAQADLMQRKALREARESLQRVNADHERGNLPTAAVAAAWQRLADAERVSGRVQQDDVGAFGPILDAAVAGLAETHARGWLGLRLPSFKVLDGKLCGLRGLMLLGAAPGVGKTQLTVQLGTDVLSDPKVGLVYLSLEMSKAELTHRLLCMASNVDYRRLRLGDQATPVGDDGLKLSSLDREALRRGHEQLRLLGPRIAMYGAGDVGTFIAGDGDPSRWYAPLVGMVEDAKRRMGVDRALVVIDNLQAIGVEPPHGRPWASDMDRDRVVIEGLTRLQHELSDPVLVVSEVAKRSFRDTDDMGAILGTGRHAYRADVVMLAKRRNADDQTDTVVDLIVDKGRDGVVRGKVALEWTGSWSRLKEAEATS